MTEEPSGSNTENIEDDDWHLYANAGYGAAESVEAETSVEEDEDTEEEWFDGDDFYHQGTSIDWDSPPCPAPLGIAHVIKIGVCDFCLHRIGGRRTKSQGFGGGAELRNEAYARDSELTKFETPEICPLCEDLFDDVGNIVERIIHSVDGVGFKSMQLGIHLPKDLLQSEDAIRTKHGSQGSRPLKASFAQAIQDEMLLRSPEISFVKDYPDIMVTVDTLTLRVDTDVRPVFIYGRYEKLVRGIPQTRWPCRSCRGRGDGCESCEGTGLQYRESVQDIIGDPVKTILDASDTSFHGMGREDIDVRCLGSGRPFVLEIKNPKLRELELSLIEDKINSNDPEKVKVNSLKWCNKKDVSRVKETRSEKSYTIRFRIDKPITEEEAIESIEALSGVTLEQETPKRVSHRRAAKTRKRRVTTISNVLVEGQEIQFSLRCEAGTYVKELVHSDEGRTSPSVSSVIDRECEVLWLDVDEIHAD
jgi:tRNA pseudouridine synthase 10